MCRIIQRKSKNFALPLREIMNELEDDDKLKNLLSSFSCAYDEDIQKFLHNRAVEFERLSKSRTYLIVSEEEFENPEVAFDEFTIYGYISLAVKVFTVPETTSNRQRQQLDGFSAKEHGKQISNFPCYLIGQLARNSNVPKESISGAELLNFAYDIIAISVDAVGGRNILVECHNNKKLLQFYLDNEFYKISQMPNETQSMIQMIRRI